MRKLLILSATAVLCLTHAAHGQLMGQRGMAGIIYQVPERPDKPKAPALSDEQSKWIRLWREKVYKLNLDWDDKGNVTEIRFSNHQVYRGDQPEKHGVTDADMKGLLAFPKLKDVGWEKQRVGNAGTAVLKQIPQIEQVRFHYMAGGLGDHDQREKIDADFMLVVDGFKKLKHLELKHLFALDATSVDKFEHRFPALEYVELDCESAGPEALHLIALAPKLKGLELHRTTLKDEEFSKLIDLAPNLVYMELKPRGHREGYITGASLRHVARLKRLQVLRLSHAGWKPLHYANGLEHLVGMKSLKTLWISKGIVSQADLDKLRKARPDLKIR